MEEKKPDEKKEEKTETKNPIDDAKEANKAEESKDPPPQEIVLRVYMHCEGCAKKVRKCLKGFEGVEDVLTDYKGHKVVVKGEKADPVKVLERVQKKSHRQVELLSPIPKPPPPPEDEKKEEKEIAKPEEKKEEPPIITVILKVYMHCEACAQEIRKRILKMKGVENVEADLKNSQVVVKGIFDPQNLVDYVRKRTGKQAVIVKQEPEKKEEEKGKEEKKGDEGGDKATKGGDEAVKEKKSGEREAGAEGEGEGGKVVDMKRNEFYYNYPQNYQIQPYPPRFEFQSYAPQIFSDEIPNAPQIFSDENPNACSVM